MTDLNTPSRKASAPIELSELRPFYLMVVVWGRTFTQHFLNLGLPSLLAPNNIPSLKNRGNKLLICTTPADWATMVATPIFKLAQRYIEPVFIEIPPAPPGKSGCEHMGVGYTKAAQMMHRDKAYGVFLAPDHLFNDGMLTTIQRQAAAGKKVVLVAGLRFGEEPLFEQFDRLGILKRGVSLAERGEPLVVSGQQLIAAVIPSLHSEVVRYGWESKCFTDFPCAVWWPVPGEDGMVVHCLSWAPLLVDYAAIDEHDASCLEDWTIDGDYIHDNFGTRVEDIHVVTDSDDIMQVSWTPLDDRPQDLTPIPSRNKPIIGELVKGSILRNAVMGNVFDPLKRRLLFITVRWHARPLTPAWRYTETKAQHILGFYLYGSAPEAPRFSLFWLAHPLRFSLRMSIVIRRVIKLTAIQFRFTHRILLMTGRALLGDRAAWARITRRVRIFALMLAGAPVKDDDAAVAGRRD